MLKLNEELEKSSFEAGRFVKLHGVAGRLVLRLNDLAEELNDFPEWVFVRMDGELVPFQVAEESVIQKDSSHLIVGFEGITDQPAARDLIGKMCNLPGARTDWFGKESTTEKTLTGYQVTEEVSGFQGVVTEFRDIPGNPLLEILFDGKNVLVPANPAFIVEVNDKAKHLILRIPPDLLNL